QTLDGVPLEDELPVGRRFLNRAHRWDAGRRRNVWAPPPPGTEPGGISFGLTTGANGTYSGSKSKVLSGQAIRAASLRTVLTRLRNVVVTVSDLSRSSAEPVAAAPRPRTRAAARSSGDRSFPRGLGRHRRPETAAPRLGVRRPTAAVRRRTWPRRA